MNDSSAIEVSIVVPAYNASRYLPATLDALLAQDGVAFEVIVVDDQSTDATAALVTGRASADARVRYLRTDHNFGGPAGPRNLGVEHARAPWVAFCDADDLWHPRKLLLQLACARATQARLVCTAIEDFADGTDPEISLRQVSEQPEHRQLGHVQTMLKNRIATSSVLCRRAAIEAAGGFDTDRSLVAVEDYDLWLRLMEQPDMRVVRIGEPLVAYRRLPGSLSANKWRHARKVMRVVRRAFERGGWHWAFPLAAPFLIASYGCQSVYLRVLRGRL
jgi:teichuronic acid biosynthesis glycosyltransferase TuaG